ncbi:hypothetical protein BDI4_570011 [Burkholderia diffusa]|nr:hypothetical protein BDI4_570011 [Burkholderia diffusa]
MRRARRRAGRRRRDRRLGKRRAGGPRGGDGDADGAVRLQPRQSYTNDKFGWYSRFVAGRGPRDYRAQRRPANHLIISSIRMFLNKKRSLSSIDRGAWPWRRWSR